MHLANTYASDLLTWQKDAKTFFQWVRIMTLFRAHEEIPTKDKHNNSTPEEGRRTCWPTPPGPFSFAGHACSPALLPQYGAGETARRTRQSLFRTEAVS